MKRQFAFILLLIALMSRFATSQSAAGLEGRWEGTLSVGPNQLRLVIEVTKTSDGLYFGSLVSVDQGGLRIPIDKIQLMNSSVHLELKAINGTFDGTLSDDKTKITGTWSQGAPLPLELRRAAATAAEATKPP